jgi:hypothetical protein
MADESKAATEFEFYTPMFCNGQLHPLLVRMLDKNIIKQQRVSEFQFYIYSNVL